jgi:hypothetical protein
VALMQWLRSDIYRLRRQCYNCLVSEANAPMRSRACAEIRVRIGFISMC